MNCLNVLPLLLLPLLTPGELEHPSGLVVIAHPDVPVTSLSSEELAHIFMGRTLEWDGGMAVVPVILSGSVHETFLRTYLKKTGDGYSAYWKRMIYTGKKKPPKSISRRDVALVYISRTPGAIGYVAADQKLDRVKIVEITP